jgi:serine protease Do
MIIILSSFAYIYENTKVYKFTKPTNQQVLVSQSKLQEEINNSRKNIITQTVENVSPAVVGINVIEIRQYRDPFSYFFDDPFFRQFFGDRRNYSQRVQGLGSGFLISPDGYIITNDHVAGNASEITVTLTDGSHHKAEIIGTDPVSDICLLKIEGKDFSYLDLGNSDDIIIGEWVIALGNPFGLFDINDQPTVTVGVISAKGMNLEPLNNRYYINMLQTDAAINGGNSGGPLVNSLGQVIGMNTLIYTAGGSQGNIGLGFAIPINKVRRIVTELKEKGKIERDFQIGMSIQSIDEGIARYYDLKSARGVIVTRVISNSPADKADIRTGDIITEIEGYKINNEKVLLAFFRNSELLKQLL